jgi:hypothetical protein
MSQKDFRPWNPQRQERIFLATWLSDGVAGECSTARHDPIPAICGDEDVALEVSLAPGSLVGWMVDGDGSELFVIHEIANPVTETIFFDEVQVATLEYPGVPHQEGQPGPR